MEKKATNGLNFFMAEICLQIEEGEQAAADDPKEILLADSSSNKTNREEFNDFTVSKMATEALSESGEFLGVCTDLEAQITIIGKRQAGTYCGQYTGIIRPVFSSRTFRFGAVRQVETGSIKIRIWISSTHIIEVNFDVVHVDVPFLLSLDLLTNLKSLLDIGKGSLASSVAG